MRKHEAGFSVIELLFILVILSTVAFTGWFVWHSKQAADKSLNSANRSGQSSVSQTGSMQSFEDCKKAAGSTTLLTYPEQCMTKDGKSFTNPSQSLNYLVIKEWGVKIPLTADIADANYQVLPTSVDAGSETVGLSIPAVAATFTDCAANKMSLAAVVRQAAAVHDANKGKPNTQDSPHPVYSKKIGDYYYQYHESTGVTATMDHPNGGCGDYASGLKYAASFQAAINHMVAAE